MTVEQLETEIQRLSTQDFTILARRLHALAERRHSESERAPASNEAFSDEDPTSEELAEYDAIQTAFERRVSLESLNRLCDRLAADFAAGKLLAVEGD